MIKKVLSLSLKAIITIVILQGGTVLAQNPSNSYNPQLAAQPAVSGEKLEALLHHFKTALENTQKQTGASEKEFGVFYRFNEKEIDIEESALYKDIVSGKINESNIDVSEQELVVKFTALYRKFQKIEVEYPSSLAEYANYNPRLTPNIVCDSACDNPNFAGGLLTGWYCAYAKDNSTVPNFIITPPVGSIAGAVSKAGGPDPFTSNDYQVEIKNVGNDPFLLTCSPSVTMPMVSPFGGSSHSARIGDSTMTLQGVGIISHTFMVTPANVNFTYQYAVVLQNPGHLGDEQPFFNAAVLDSVGDTIPTCGKYLVKSGAGTGGKGWDSTLQGGFTKIYYRNWTSVFTSLKAYVGHCVTVSFEVSDCSQGGHFGYAYITTSCASEGLISSSPAFCGQTSITLTGPPGGTKYTWTGPPGNSIIGSDSAQLVTVDSSGQYQLIVQPVTGGACNDTLKINIPKAPGPPPVPFFHADTACSGQATQFNNLSNPLIGPNTKFYWDFFNTGQYEDSTTNPTWVYNAAGNYTVKLEEINNGCGNDTLIHVKVDSTVTGAYTSNTICVGSTEFFNNTTVGGSNYFWNYGNPSSGTLDTASVKNGFHTYDSVGIYQVYMIANKGSKCPDTTRQSLSVLPVPKPFITGRDSVCQGTGTNLSINAPGTSSWTWTPGAPSINCPTCQNVTATPTVTTTYTISASNAACSHDTTFTVYVKPLPPPGITVRPSSDTICLGDSARLIATGGCSSYLWANNGSTADSIWAKPAINTTYSVTVDCNGCTANTSQQIIVVSPSAHSINLAKDSICPYDSTTMTANGGVGAKYHWLAPIAPANAGNATVTVKAGSTTTFEVVISSRCALNDTLKKVLHIAPVPVINVTGNTTICFGKNTSLGSSGGSGYTWSPPTGLSCNNCPNPTASPTSTTDYTLTVTNSKCKSDTVIPITVNPLPIINMTATPTNICFGSPSVLAATGGGTYQWSNGATTSSVSVTPGRNTTYSVVVNNSFGCTDSNRIGIVVDSPYFQACCDSCIIKGSTVDIGAYGVGMDYAWTPSEGLSCANCPYPEATPTITTTYTVTSVDIKGCRTSRTVTICLECLDFTVPNVFTPNDDGINDDFEVKLNNYTTYSIKIYDRWGKEIYTSTDPSVYWTGRINNTQNMVPDGTYFYEINATCDANTYKKKGFVQVITGGK